MASLKFKIIGPRGKRKIVYDQEPEPVQARPKKPCGFAGDWAILSDDALGIIVLFNVVTERKIKLPSVSSAICQEYCTATTKNHVVHKAELFSDPDETPDDLDVLVIYGEPKQLFIFQSATGTWISFQDAGYEYDDIRSWEELIR